MDTTSCFQSFSHIFRAPSGKNLGALLIRPFWFVGLIFAMSSAAKGQAIGYVLNSTDGTVTIFATSDNPFAGGTAESPLTTVKVCATPLNAAPTPDFNHAYVTCADNSLWSIDVTHIVQKTATAQNILGSQLNAPGGIAILTPPTGANATKTLAYIVNSASNTVSVIDTFNNTLYDGPIALGSSPAAGAGTGFAGLAAAAPDSTRVFVTINNPTPQLWMIDTTVKPETAVQIQAAGLPTAAIDSLYLSVQESTSGTDYYVTLTTSVPVVLQASPSLFLVDIEPAMAAGSPGSSSNPLFTVAPLGPPGTSQPTHVASLIVETTPTTPVITAYTVDQTDLLQIIFSCNTAMTNNPGSCTASTSTSAPVTGGDLLPIAPNGLALTGVPFNNGGGSKENVYVTDGQPNGIVQIQVQLSSSGLSGSGVLPSLIKVGNGAQPPVFSPLSPASGALAFFAALPLVAPVGFINVQAVGFVNPHNTSGLNFSISTNTSSCGSGAPCIITTQDPVVGIDQGIDFPASGVFTVMLQGTGTSGGTPLPPGQQTTRQIYIGANCTLNSAGVTPAPKNVAVGQTVTVNLSCIAPTRPSDTPTTGDSITGHLNWGDGTSSAPTNLPVTAALSNNAALLTFSHSYATPNTYNISVMDLTDLTDGTPGSPSGGPIAVIVNALAVSVSPSVISVQVPSHSVSFAAAVQFDPSNSGVTWALSGSDCAGATCGTLSTATQTSVTYTAPTAVPPSGTVSLTATSHASISYADANQSSSVPIKLTTSPPPSCTLAAPSAGQTSLTITANVTCTAPAGDSLTAKLNWGDGTPAATNTATAATNGSATFSPFTHAYTSASNPSYSISLNVSDTTTGFAGSVTPPSVVLTVLQTTTIAPPVSMSTVNVVQGQAVNVPFLFSGGPAGITFTSITCAVAPQGPSCTVSPTSVTLDANGTANIQVTVMTTGPATALLVPRSENQQALLSASLLSVPGLGLLLLGLSVFTTKSRRSPVVLTLFLLVNLGIFGTGCGSTTRSSALPCTACTAAGSYTVTVTATSQKPVLQASGIVRVVVSQ